MTEKRKALGKKVRFDVFKRDQFTCCYCGRKPPVVVLQVDHIVPVIEGGGDEIANLATSCFDCNSGKSGTPLSQLPQAVSDRREMMIEREEQERAYIKFVRARRKRQDALIQEVCDALNGPGYQFTANAATSVRRFLERMPFDRVLFAAEKARATAGGNAFKYFCGVCWKILADAEGP